MQRWTPQHAKFVGRVIFANFLSLPLKNYRSIIEEVERLSIFKRLSRDSWDQKRNSPAIRIRPLSRTKTLNENENRSPGIVAKIAKQGNRFTIRYACEGFNKMYVIDNVVRDELGADSNIRSMLFGLRRISSRNALTHGILREIIEHQKKFLRTGEPINLMPLTQVELTEWMNRVRSSECGTFSNSELGARNSEVSPFPTPRSAFRIPRSICNSWVSRLVNGISVIIPSGEEKPLRSFFQTQKDVNKRLIKQLLDEENQDLESGTLERPLTDDQIRANLETKYGVRRSRHSIANCRKDMGIPAAKRRLSGYKYPPLSANFSMLYPLTVESVKNNTPTSPGVYEFRLNGKEIEYPNGKTNVIYLGSAMKLKKRLKEHLRANNKNGHIRGFLKSHDCSFRYIQFSKNWKEEERRLYELFFATYGSAPRCNSVKP